MFDLDFENKNKIKEYNKFRKFILSQGFSMMQFSIYIKYFTNLIEAEAYKNRIKKLLPSCGNIRFLNVTEIQYQKMDVINNKLKEKPEEKNNQLLLF